MKDVKRGSEYLLEHWQKGPAISDELVRGIVEATDGLEIHDILIKGQPRPDLLRLAASTDEPERCGTTVGGLLGVLQKHGNQGLPVIRVFPRGIPWPDRFDIQVAIGEDVRH